MEPKKTTKADLTRKSWLFFNIGLTFSLLLVVMAFEYNKSENADIKNLNRVENTFEKLVDIPPTEQPPPPPPKIVQPRIVEVKNEEKIKDEIKVDFDVEVNQDTKVQDIVIAPVEEPKEDVNQVFLVVEEPASPQGGMQAFYDYVGKQLKYPAQARRMNVEGRVFVQFVVERDGSLTDVKAIKGIGAGCDEEAVRVVESAPPWTPGKQRGKPVRVRMVLPIVFKLN